MTKNIHLHVCPDCNGKGKIDPRDYAEHNIDTDYVTDAPDFCYRCHGTGRIDDLDDGLEDEDGQ